MSELPIIAICGKGGVGKTAVCALLARALLDAGVKPLLLVDADPVGGLTAALGLGEVRTLGAVREQILATVRQGEDGQQKVADQLDYLVLEALEEQGDYSLFAMGRSTGKGCYCPVNSLLREAIDLIVDPFAAVLIDAEAGLEQINRQVTRRVSRIVVVTDGSARSSQTLGLIAQLVEPSRIAALANRSGGAGALPKGATALPAVPEDEALRQLDRTGRSLWELPADSPARAAAREVARALGLA